MGNVPNMTTAFGDGCGDSTSHFFTLMSIVCSSVMAVQQVVPVQREVFSVSRRNGLSEHARAPRDSSADSGIHPPSTHSPIFSNSDTDSEIQDAFSRLVSSFIVSLFFINYALKNVLLVIRNLVRLVSQSNEYHTVDTL